jgi:hypothetical protein
MTNKFDPNATPECDEYDPETVDLLEIAKSLERRMRVYQKRLKEASSFFIQSGNIVMHKKLNDKINEVPYWTFCGEERNMTNKFDPNATPECDRVAESLDYPGFKATDWYRADSYRSLAIQQEKRARKAEEKLEIVFGNFDAFQKKHGDCHVAELLNCIEREFELRGVK